MCDEYSMCAHISSQVWFDYVISSVITAEHLNYVCNCTAQNMILIAIRDDGFDYIIKQIIANWENCLSSDVWTVVCRMLAILSTIIIKIFDFDV